MDKSVLWRQVQMILENLSVLINRVAAVVKTPTGKNQMLVTGGDGQSKWVDRTHWADVERETILPKTSLEYQSGPGQFAYTGELPALTIGETYTISWNGVEYQCEATKPDMGGMPAVGFGNLGAIGAGAATDDPFSIVVVPPEMVEAFGGYSLIAIPLDMLETLELAIFSEVTVVKKIDPKYLPDGIGGGADWNAKEGEPGHILNKPFYDYEATVIPETKLVFGDMEGMMVAPFQEAANLEAGKTYKIKYNGVTYNCDCVIMESGAGWGNFSIFGLEDTGEPFLLAAQGEESMVMSLEGLSEATMSVAVEAVSKLDTKYLPFSEIDLSQYQEEAYNFQGGSVPSGNVVNLPDRFVEQLSETLESGFNKISILITGGVKDAVSTSDGGISYFDDVVTVYAMLSAHGIENGRPHYLYAGFLHESVVYVEFNLGYKTAKIKISKCINS